MALRASSSSSVQSGPFMARNTPPVRTNGRHSSLSRYSRATARETAASNCPRSSDASSARACRHVTSVRPAAAQTSPRKRTRLSKLSSSVSEMSGCAIFSGRPGKPAPVPTSMTALPASGSTVSRAAESRKCSCATSVSPWMAVRFMTLLRSSSSV